RVSGPDGAARGDREPDLDRAAHLQRGGTRLQQPSAALPDQRDRARARLALHQAAVLRGGSGFGAGAPGRLLRPVKTARARARLSGWRRGALVVLGCLVAGLGSTTGPAVAAASLPPAPARWLTDE